MIMMDEEESIGDEEWSIWGLQDQLGCDCEILRGEDMRQCLVYRKLYFVLLGSIGLCGVKDDINVGVRGRYVFCEEFNDESWAFLSALLFYRIPAVSV